jgi:hypothetical protein
VYQCTAKAAPRLSLTAEASADARLACVWRTGKPPQKLHGGDMSHRGRRREDNGSCATCMVRKKWEACESELRT